MPERSWLEQDLIAEAQRLYARQEEAAGHTDDAFKTNLFPPIASRVLPPPPGWKFLTNQPETTKEWEAMVLERTQRLADVTQPKFASKPGLLRANTGVSADTANRPVSPLTATSEIGKWWPVWCSLSAAHSPLAPASSSPNHPAASIASSATGTLPNRPAAPLSAPAQTAGRSSDSLLAPGPANTSTLSWQQQQQQVPQAYRHRDLFQFLGVVREEVSIETQQKAKGRARFQGGGGIDLDKEKFQRYAERKAREAPAKLQLKALAL